MRAMNVFGSKGYFSLLVCCAIGGMGSACLAGELCSRESWGDKDGRAKVDFNRDGYLDYCRVEGPANNGSVCCTLSLPPPAGTKLPEQPASTPVPVDQKSQQGKYKTWIWGYMKGEHIKVDGVQLGETQGRAWVDVNGDGYPDYCRVVPKADGGIGLSCLINQRGKGFGPEVQSTVKLDPHDAATRTWVDVTGEGNADFCRVEPNDILVCNLSSPGFKTVVKDVILPNEKQH